MKRYPIVLLAAATFLSGCGTEEVTIPFHGNNNETLIKLEKGEPVIEGQEVTPGSQTNSSMKIDINIDLLGTKIVNEDNAIIIRMGDGVLFHYDEAELYEESEQVFAELDAAFAKLPKNSKLKIEAHTDDKADNEFNLQLTKDRANLLFEHFKGVKDLEHLVITAEGVGESRPIVPNDGNAENHQLNRRIDFIIQEPGKRK
jgi:outer membrane protein OmpA-like peptidoglycan-associated protein